MIIEVRNCTLRIDDEKGELEVVNCINRSLVKIVGMPPNIPDPFKQSLHINVQEGVKYFNWKNDRRGR